MPTEAIRNQLSTYAAGAALGASAMLAATMPHLAPAAGWSAQAPVHCSGRVSPAHLDDMRSEVLRLQAERERRLAGGSRYAAAKAAGALTPAALTDLRAAAEAEQRARARLAAACG